MDKPVCSLITIMNKAPVFQAFQENLQTQQDISYELICIDNTAGQYNAARQAYLEMAQKAKGEYLVFLHPDIRFLDPTALRDIMNCVQDLGAFGVAGVAGSPERLENKDRVILSTIVHGEAQEAAGRQVATAEQVQTLDECLFVVRRTYFLENPFSDSPGWHLYCVEHCLQCIVDGRNNYVVPARIWHLSNGKSLDYRYMLQLEQLIKKYAPQFSTINTTVKKWTTRGVIPRLYRRYYLFKQYIKGILQR